MLKTIACTFFAMEISTEIDKKKNIRWHIVRGVIDMGQLFDSLKEIYNSPDFDPEMDILWDLQKADFSSVQTEDIRSFAKYVGKQWEARGKGKAALVVSSDFDYGMTRMYQMLLESTTSNEVTVFKDIAKAKKWIDAEI